MRQLKAKAAAIGYPSYQAPYPAGAVAAVGTVQQHRLRCTWSILACNARHHGMPSAPNRAPLCCTGAVPAVGSGGTGGGPQDRHGHPAGAAPVRHGCCEGARGAAHRGEDMLAKHLFWGALRALWLRRGCSCSKFTGQQAGWGGCRWFACIVAADFMHALFNPPHPQALLEHVQLLEVRLRELGVEVPPRPTAAEEPEGQEAWVEFHT